MLFRGRFLSLFLLGVFAVAPPASAELKQWRIDSAHSYVGFKVRHLMVSWVRGRFTTLRGSIWYDAADPTKTRMEITIETASVDTRNERRDEHLRSADFFDVEKHPEMRFVSKTAKAVADGKLEIAGELTIRGVTREVTLSVDGPSEPIKHPRMGERSGATAATKISRKDFGLVWNRALEAGGVTVGDEVTIEIEAELAAGGRARGKRGKRGKKAGD